MMAFGGLDTTHLAHDVIIEGLGFGGDNILVENGYLAQRLALDGMIRLLEAQRSTHSRLDVPPWSFNVTLERAFFMGFIYLIL
jgi:hypothetical protein